MQRAAGTFKGKDEGWMSPQWYPTLSMDLEIKKLLPEEGVEWLFVRSQATQIKDGRMDVTVWILDEGGELVAISHHVCFIVNIAANMARGKKQAGKEQSKL